MSKTDKLLKKLAAGTINAKELRTLMMAMGAELVQAKGSHERWYLGDKRMVLATHGKDLKLYQIKQARFFLGVKDEN